MTGFGAAGASVRVEVTSVNGRGLSVKCRLPEALQGCQPAVEERVRGKLARGTVTVAAELREGRRAALDRKTLAAYARELRAAGKDLGLPPPDWRTLTSLPGVLRPQRIDAEPALLAALDGALAACGQDRAREGRALAGVLQRLLTEAGSALKRAEALRESALRALRDRMSVRLKEALAREGLDADLKRELVLLVERSDIAEEVDRLKVHLLETKKTLTMQEPAGRRLDFLAQEMMREANTLGSKAADGDLSRAGLDLKTALDRFREQVQNVE